MTGARVLLVPRPPPRLPAPAAVASAMLQALKNVHSKALPHLDAGQFEAPDCMQLELDFEQAAALAPPSLLGDGGVDSRAQLLSSLLQAFYAQNKDWVAGFAAPFSRRDIDRVARIQVVLRVGAPAEASLVSAVQAQCVRVQVGDCEVVVPVRPVLATLPAEHVQLVVQGVPARYVRQGVTEALLAAAGLTAAAGWVVAHERAGCLALPGGELCAIPVLDTIVAVVAAPDVAGLSSLPPFIEGDGWRATLAVRYGIVAARQVVIRQVRPPPPPPQRQPPDVVHPGVRPGMAGVYAASGIGRQALATAGRLAADAVGRAALQPGARTGLGFAHDEAALPPAPVTAVAIAAATAGTAGCAAGVAAATAAVGDPMLVDRPCRVAAAPVLEVMPPAADALAVPRDEPGFEAACMHVQDCMDGLSVLQVHALVLQAKQCAPAAYAEVEGAATPSQLTLAFRRALHSQARVTMGHEAASPLYVGPVEHHAALPSLAEVLHAAASPGGGSALEGGAAVAAVVAATATSPAPTPSTSTSAHVVVGTSLHGSISGGQQAPGPWRSPRDRMAIPGPGSWTGLLATSLSTTQHGASRPKSKHGTNPPTSVSGHGSGSRGRGAT